MFILFLCHLFSFISYDSFALLSFSLVCNVWHTHICVGYWPIAVDIMKCNVQYSVIIIFLAWYFNNLMSLTLNNSKVSIFCNWSFCYFSFIYSPEWLPKLHDVGDVELFVSNVWQLVLMTEFFFILHFIKSESWENFFFLIYITESLLFVVIKFYDFMWLRLLVYSEPKLLSVGRLILSIHTKLDFLFEQYGRSSCC